MGMAFDAARGVALLYGGQSGTTFFSDTWGWNGVTWTQYTSAGGVARSTHAMAYDSVRTRVVSFGGNSTLAGAPYAQTWEWNGTNWANQATTTNPTARTSPSMTFDSLRGKIVLFGGYASVLTNDTWEYTGP